jgi:hypothetical protein
MSQRQLNNFHFRNLHPQILIGTASDHYAGWLGQVYSHDQYQGYITKRIKVIAGRTFVEEVLPVHSVVGVLRTLPGPGDRFHVLPAAPMLMVNFEAVMYVANNCLNYKDILKLL